MARTSANRFSVELDSIMTGFHFYMRFWTPVENELLFCKEDVRIEAKAHDPNSIGVYTQTENKLVGHVQREMAKAFKIFLASSSSNKIDVLITGEKKNLGKKKGLVLPCKYTCISSNIVDRKAIIKDLCKVNDESILTAITKLPENTEDEVQ